ncbi:MAG: HupE/UreJ family protein, partial [Acidobacteriota bacterium]
NSDQVVFDQGTQHREIRFHPPSLTETVARDGSAGALQLLRSVAGLLFLLTLVLAARGSVEAAILALVFLAAQWLARPIGGFLPAGLSPQFLEMVIALTVAYLAVEVVFLPEGRARWVIIPILGIIHGLPFAAFPPFYLVGATVVQVLILIALIVGAGRLPGGWRRYAAGFAGIAALGWFARLLMA